MRRRRVSWSDLLRNLGGALLELLQAELAALSADLKASGRSLGGALLLILVAAFLGFWTLGLLAYSAVELLTLWLPRWGAALAVFGATLLATAVFGLVGWWRVRRIESPADTVRRHVQEHVAWLEENVLEPGAALPETSDLEE